MAGFLLPKWLRRDGSHGELFVGAHDILDEKADWDSATWLFDPKQIPRFVATLERLYELMPMDFDLVAAWGEEPSREQRTTRDELLGIVSDNALGNAVLYRVSVPPAKDHLPAVPMSRG
jgi:hypothetical protein